MQASQNKIFLPFLVPSQWKAKTPFWVMISQVSVSMQENLFIDKYSLSLQMSDDDIFIYIYFFFLITGPQVNTNTCSWLVLKHRAEFWEKIANKLFEGVAKVK
jgi:hypothetical protein